MPFFSETSRWGLSEEIEGNKTLVDTLEAGDEKNPGASWIFQSIFEWRIEGTPIMFQTATAPMIFSSSNGGNVSQHFFWENTDFRIFYDKKKGECFPAGVDQQTQNIPWFIASLPMKKPE